MSKRKAGVNDIIYELDNDDVDSISEDEAMHCNKKEQEIIPVVPNFIEDSVEMPSERVCVEVVDVDSSSDDVTEFIAPVENHNGGKLSPTVSSENSAVLNETEMIISRGIDIIEDSCTIESLPSDSNIAGCSNRTPLIAMKFQNKTVARCYKHKIKEFMFKLIKLHDNSSLNGSESETDLELDIWPEDLECDTKSQDENDKLFFVDTVPGVDSDIPQYSQASTVMSDIPDIEPTPETMPRRGPSCFNCEGAHALRDCDQPRNNAKIAFNRKAIVKVGRYHVEDDQKFGHLIPGRTSGLLRHALGLNRNEIPLHIYRMRLLGYPPGWLEEARISHSGISMFDSTGQAIQDPEDEEGEICEPGSKDKYDIKKILDFPGFNVKTSSRYKDDAHIHGLPPMAEQDSKLLMLEALAPNAMKAYKRKKLTLFPSASQNSSVVGAAEMELEDEDETPEFPTVPPLPDDAPPPLPPPPDVPPPPETPPPIPTEPPPTASPPIPPLPKDPPLEPPTLETEELNTSIPQPPENSDDVSTYVISSKSSNYPLSTVSSDTIKAEDFETISEMNSEVSDTEACGKSLDNGSIEIVVETSSYDISLDGTSKHDSLSLNDLEEKKKLLLEALDNTSPNPRVESNGEDSISKDLNENGPTNVDVLNTKPTTGYVKTTSFGTPVMNIASPYIKLPSDEKFAKDICDVINFENLPDSTGKYSKICNLLKRVKTEVDRIQES